MVVYPLAALGFLRDVDDAATSAGKKFDANRCARHLGAEGRFDFTR
jgi:hypothetical protein